MRPCRRCGDPAEWKSQYCGSCKAIRRGELREQNRLRAAERRRDPAVRERERQAAADYRRRHPEKIRAARRRDSRGWYLRRAYRLTEERYAALVEAQDGRCAICGEPKSLHIDHDHETGRVRGLLCGSCNRGIGQLGESIERLLAAIAYLTPARAELEAIAS